jgi:hypothetical protein
MRIDANGSRSSCLGVRTTALELGEGALDMGVGVDGVVEGAPASEQVGVADVRDRVDRRSVLSELHHAASVAAASVTPTAAPSACHYEHE